MGKQTVVPPEKGMLFSDKKKRATGYEKSVKWRSVKCILLSGRNGSEKAAYCVTPPLRHAGKGNTRETGTRPTAAGVQGANRWSAGHHGPWKRSVRCYSGGSRHDPRVRTHRTGNAKSGPSCRLQTPGDDAMSAQAHQL